MRVAKSECQAREMEVSGLVGETVRVGRSM